MKKVLLTAMTALLAAFITGCKTSYRDGGADGLYRPKSRYVSNYYTEYDVSNERLSGKGSSSVLFWFFQFSEGKYCLLDSDPNITIWGSFLSVFSPTQIAVGNAKKSALFNVLSEINADQLLGTSYEYTVTNYFVYTTVDCKVKGFPATVKGVKFYDKRPVILNKWQKIEYIAPQDYPIDYSNKINEHQHNFFTPDKQ